MTTNMTTPTPEERAELRELYAPARIGHTALASAGRDVIRLLDALEAAEERLALADELVQEFHELYFGGNYLNVVWPIDRIFAYLGMTEDDDDDE